MSRSSILFRGSLGVASGLAAIVDGHLQAHPTLSGPFATRQPAHMQCYGFILADQIPNIGMSSVAEGGSVVIKRPSTYLLIADHLIGACRVGGEPNSDR